LKVGARENTLRFLIDGVLKKQDPVGNGVLQLQMVAVKSTAWTNQKTIRLFA